MSFSQWRWNVVKIAVGAPIYPVYCLWSYSRLAWLAIVMAEGNLGWFWDWSWRE